MKNLRVSDLTPNERNPRKITDEKLAMLKNAVREFGDLSGIIYNRKSKQLVGGHQRTKLVSPDATVHVTKTYPKPTKTGTVAEGFIEIGGDRFAYREVSWDKHREMAANIAANKGAGEWDMPELTKWMKELASFDADDFDMSLTMFDEDELDPFGVIEVDGYTRTGATGVDEDEIPEKPASRTRPGYIYELGEHRLVCGSATNADDWKKLGVAGAAVVFSSPPYGVGVNARLRDKYVKGAEKRSSLYETHTDDPGEWPQLMREWIALALKNSQLVICNIQSLANNKRNVMAWAAEFAPNLVDVAIWDKGHGAPQMQKNVLTNAFEWLFLLAPKDDASRSIPLAAFHGDESNMVRISAREKREFADVHGGTMPVALAAWGIALASRAECVIDPFGGTGTTMIAAEKAGKKAYLIELDTYYCDVIVERWEKYTGQKAKLLNPNKMPVTTKLRKAGEQPKSSHA